MTRTIGANLKSHLAQEVTTLAYLWDIERTDGVHFRFTDYDKNIDYAGYTYYSANSASYTGIKQSDELNVDNFDFETILDDNALDIDELRAGLFDYAGISVFLINYETPADGVISLIRGFLGEVEILGDNKARAEFRSIAQLLNQVIGRVYGLECDADLGDSRCKISLAAGAEKVTDGAFTGDGSAWTMGTGWALDDPNNEMDCDGSQTANSDLSQDIGATSGKIYKVSFTVKNYTAGNLTPLLGTAAGSAVPADGSYVQYITAQAATLYLRADADFIGSVDDVSVKQLSDYTVGGIVTSVTDNRRFADSSRTEADDYFNYGLLTWISGSNKGISKEVKNFVNATGAFKLVGPMPFTVAVGDIYEVYRGCDKKKTTCKNVFNNMINFRGFPFTPGVDKMLDYPDAH